MSKAWADIVPSEGVTFIKMQGLHNHFIIVDGQKTPCRPTSDEINHICNVKSGIGAACVTPRAVQLPGLTRKTMGTEEMAAGSVEIDILKDNSAIMTGPVEFCFSGTLSGLEGQPG